MIINFARKSLFSISCFLLLTTAVEQGVDSEINVSSCTSETQYFDSMQFLCIECPVNMKADESGLNCVCDESSVLIDQICTKCAAGESPNKNGTICTNCETTGITKMDTSVAGQCTCDDGKIVKDRDDNGKFVSKIIDGKPVETLSCFECP